MKHLNGADAAAPRDNWEGIEELLAQLWACLSPALTDASGANPSSRLRRSQACDRVLRVCVEQMGKAGGGPDAVGRLLSVAEAACQGYLNAIPQPAPLYLEKILYHLLRNVAARGAGACWRAAELLRARLLASRPGPLPSKDFKAIACSSFGLLWRGGASLAEPCWPQEEARAGLLVRLRALRFLLLLEEDGEALSLLQPPFFTSQTAQQAAAAAAMYEAQPEPCSAFLAQQLGDCLLAVLRKEATEPPSLQQCLCFFELTQERCRHLCRGSRYSEAKEAVKEARGFLGDSSNTKSFSAPLTLLQTGVQLSQALAEDACPTEPLFSQAAAALRDVAELSEQFLMVLAESCQFVSSVLSECMKRSKQQPFSLGDVLDLCAFTQGSCRVLHRLLDRGTSVGLEGASVWAVGPWQPLASPFSPQPLQGWPGLEQLPAGCRRSVEWMLEALEGLPESEQAKYLDVTVSCTFKLAYIFYSQNLHEEASSICEPLCKGLQALDAYECPEIPAERLHKCFRLQVESHRKLGWPGRALASVEQWLLALRGRTGDLLAEPISLWVRVKSEAGKQGHEELRLRTLKDGLKGHNLPTETLVTVLFAELKAYKTVRADTGQERYNVLCDLLELCSEDSGRLHERAVGLTELAQVLCYHSYSQQTDCSSLDSIQEALRLLELVPRSTQNRDQLLDDQAQALLWLYICTLESKLEKNIEREQRAKAQGLRRTEDFEPNDLNYEGRLLEEEFLYEGISFNLETETALSKHLDDAFALWKQLLAAPGIPAVRSPEQTVASLRLLAALYKLMAKPLQALESYLLVKALCSALGDSLGTANALCQVTRLLFQLECPSYAQLFLEETESCLRKADSNDSSYVVLQQSCLLLRSHLCCVSQQIEEGLSLLLKVLQNMALQKVTKVWYLLRAQLLQLVATYLSLPLAHLSPELRQQIFEQGWKTPETALVEAQKLFRSIILLLMGSRVLGSLVTFLPCLAGDNLLLKWQVLAEVLACSEHVVALLSRLEVVCKAKAFCLEGVKLAVRLQATRLVFPSRSTSFLVLKAQLELQQSELELSHSDLQQALYILDSIFGSGFCTHPWAVGKGKLEGRKKQDSIPEPPGEEEGFLKGPTLAFVATMSEPVRVDALSASPELKPVRRKRPSFLRHPTACPCCLCSDLCLSALGLRWLLSCAQAELAAGGTAKGLALLRAMVPRCATAATRFTAELQDKLWGTSTNRDPPALELLHDLVASAYATLALQSLASPGLAEELETGLKFLASCRPHVPSLEVSRATLLLAKATAAFSHGDGIFASSWSQQLPAPAPAEVKKSQRPKPSAMPSTEDVFALSDLDTEVPPIVIRPVPVPCTPHQRPRPPSRTPFTIFSESSPPSNRAQLLRAPRVLGRVKTRLQVSGEDGEGQLRGSSQGLSTRRSCAQPRRGRPGTRRAASRRAEEECELPRATEAEEKGEEELQLSFELLQDSEEEAKAPGELLLSCPPMPLQGVVPISPRHLHPSPQAGGSSLGAGRKVQAGRTGNDTILKLLKDAFNCISHCPPSTLHSQLCQLLALATGSRDPLSTAYLLSESFSITTRHQLLDCLFLCSKGKKSVGDVAEQLKGLCLQEGSSAQRSQHLAELERLFMFSSTGLGPEERDRFGMQLQQIPSGVTVCMLTLASTQPGSIGDTLLLTRLERGSPPVNIRIPKAPLRSVLRDFDTIQKEQKEANACTDKQDWWLRRFELDRRMKSLIETLELQVLGCWRGVLLPTSPEPTLAEEASQLHPQLLQCGWRDTDPTLLKTLLNAAPLLSPCDVQAVAFGLCSEQPRRAQLLLQEAMEKLKACTKQSSSSLVLVLDKHLQKLPWESMGCLKAVPVTRLPSLRFLLSYSLAQKAGSVLSRGVNPSSTFYVLNPHSNLKSTEERFRGWFESEPGWKGVTGAVPSPEQMQAALLEHDLYIYAGHGAGARFLDGQTISRLECRAVTLLFGCSSALLVVRGSLEGSGIILKYIMAGCPLVLGNLWDVTDRDMDRYAQALLEGWLRGGSGAPLLHYMAQARQAPKLKYLIGAAPVAYGLPVCLQ
uniref:separase n=1 Tax=Melopsittacus undulatus TaxID=13146 RepID=A0A8V5GRR5_MELUD